MALRATAAAARALGADPGPGRARIPQPLSPLVEEFRFMLRAESLPPYELEHRFSSERAWRFDLAWPARLVAVECEGGTRSRGRHVRAEGFERDAEKYNAAVVLGWRVLRYTMPMIRAGAAVADLRALLLEDATR